MTEGELVTYFNMMKEYHDHLLCQSPEEKQRAASVASMSCTMNGEGISSLIARMYGIFTVEMEDIAPVNLILMGNTIDGKPLLTFDLKGSIINRKTEVEGKKMQKVTLKDVNLLNLQKSAIFLRFSKTDRRNILAAMRRDVNFLEKMKLMDYSLLLGIEMNPKYLERKEQ